MHCHSNNWKQAKRWPLFGGWLRAQLEVVKIRSNYEIATNSKYSGFGALPWYSSAQPCLSYLDYHNIISSALLQYHRIRIQILIPRTVKRDSVSNFDPESSKMGFGVKSRSKISRHLSTQPPSVITNWIHLCTNLAATVTFHAAIYLDNFYNFCNHQSLLSNETFRLGRWILGFLVIITKWKEYKNYIT